MRRHLQLGLVLLGTAALLAAGTVGARPALGATSPVLSDCGHHASLSQHYSIAQLHQALSTMSAFTREYTSCPDVINRALAAAVSGQGGSGTGATGSGSFLPTPVLIVLVVLLLGSVTFGAMAVRRRRAPPDPT